MRRIPLLFLLAAVFAVHVAPQSGRRITTPASATPAAPIQPPLNPEPEIKISGPPPLTNLLFLPEDVWEQPIKAFDNHNFKLGDFHGKVVVINLWASWCGPCRREVPEYEKVRKTYTNGDVVFIGLTMEDPRYENERVQRFVREVGFGFRLGWANRELARNLTNGKRSIPQTLVIDQEGRIISHWDGYSPGHSGDRLNQTIKQALTRE
jgi:thiol-disulfide isomerase/thioredoxin